MPPRSSTAEEEYVLVWVEGFGPAFVYDPQQKRIPAGQPGGGRWVDVPWTDLGWDHPDNKPPAPQGNPEGGKPGGYASNGLDVSAAGNVGERIAEKFGVVRDEHRELNEKGELKNQASMDALKPPNYAFEVKTRFTTDGEYRVGMKRGGGERLDEIADKEKWSRENEKKPGVMVIIHNPETKESWAYYRMGIRNGAIKPETDADWERTSEKHGWKFIGKVQE